MRGLTLLDAGFVGALGGTTGLPVTDGLWGHYDAQALTGFSDTDPVETWPDLSGNGRDLTQGTLSLRPLYAVGGVNGRPALDFTAATNRFFARAVTLSQPFTFMAVVGFGSASGSGEEVLSAPSVSALAVNANVIIAAGLSVTATGARSTTPSAFAFLFDGTSSLIRRDGAQVASGNVGTGGLSSTFRLGVNSSAAGGLRGKLGEFAVYSRALNGTELAAVEGYMKSRWGTP